MALELWIPDAARPKERCPICGHPFYKGEERKLDKHVRECAEEHRDKIEAFRTPDPFESITDEEYESWVRRMGRVR